MHVWKGLYWLNFSWNIGFTYTLREVFDIYFVQLVKKTPRYVHTVVQNQGLNRTIDLENRNSSDIFDHRFLDEFIIVKWIWNYRHWYHSLLLQDATRCNGLMETQSASSPPVLCCRAWKVQEASPVVKTYCIKYTVSQSGVFPIKAKMESTSTFTPTVFHRGPSASLEICVKSIGCGEQRFSLVCCLAMEWFHGTHLIP